MSRIVRKGREIGWPWMITRTFVLARSLYQIVCLKHIWWCCMSPIVFDSKHVGRLAALYYMGSVLLGRLSPLSSSLSSYLRYCCQRAKAGGAAEAKKAGWFFGWFSLSWEALGGKKEGRFLNRSAFSTNQIIFDSPFFLFRYWQKNRRVWLPPCLSVCLAAFWVNHCPSVDIGALCAIS